MFGFLILLLLVHVNLLHILTKNYLVVKLLLSNFFVLTRLATFISFLDLLSYNYFFRVIEMIILLLSYNLRLLFLFLRGLHCLLRYGGFLLLRSRLLILFILFLILLEFIFFNWRCFCGGFFYHFCSFGK